MNKNSEYSPEATRQRGRRNEEADGARGAAALGNLVAHVILSKCTREGNFLFFFPVTNMKPVTVKHPCRKFRITLGSSAELSGRERDGKEVRAATWVSTGVQLKVLMYLRLWQMQN